MYNLKGSEQELQGSRDKQGTSCKAVGSSPGRKWHLSFDVQLPRSDYWCWLAHSCLEVCGKSRARAGS